MLSGYITYDELKIITGYNDAFLSKLITKGLKLHEADLEYNNKKKPTRESKYRQMLFDINEVENWLRVHVF